MDDHARPVHRLGGPGKIALAQKKGGGGILGKGGKKRGDVEGQMGWGGGGFKRGVGGREGEGGAWG